MTLISHNKVGRKNIILLKCDNCGGEYFAKKGTRDLDRELHFCSQLCARQSLSIGKLKDKIQTSNLKKYGFVSAASSAEIRSKIEETNLQRYGAPNPFMNPVIQNKAQQTNLERYGNTCSLTNDTIKNKRDQTWINKYGGSPLSNELIQSRIKQTNLEKYGSEIFTNSEYYKETVKKNNLKKYGVESVFSVPEVRDKIKQTNLEKYGSEVYAGSSDWESKLDRDDIVRKAWITKIKNGTCSKSGPEEKLNTILIKIFGSASVQRQVSLLKQWIDFYVVPLKLYIQVDGVYWHGLNRDIETIKNGSTSQDKKIYEQVLRDEKLNQYMKDSELNLLRITDEQINKMSDEEIINLVIGL